MQLVDVRARAEHEESHIAGSKLIPVDDLRGRLGEIDPARPVIVYCRIGLRGYLAARILAGHGFRARNLTGGIRSWHFDLVGRQHVAAVDRGRDVPRT